MRVSRAMLWWALPVALSFVMLALAPLREGDLGWHVRLGEAMVTERAIPQFDRWSVGGTGQPFNAAHSWLGDVVLYLVWRYGGLAGLVLLQALTGCVTVALLLDRVAREVAPPYAAILALLGFLVLYPFSTARPQMFSFAAFALLGWLLERWQTTHAERYLHAIPLVMAVWVNAHGAWSMGALLLALMVLEATLAAVRRQAPWGEALILGRYAALSVAATLLNPQGVGVYRYLLVMSTSPISQQFVSEWQPPTLAQRFTWPFWLVLVLSAALAGARPRRWRGALRAAVFAGLALRYVRMLPFAALALAPWAAGRLRTVWPAARRFVTAEAYPWATRALLAALAAACVVAVPWVRMALGVTALPLLDPFFPEQAVTVVAQVASEGAGLFTLPEWGGYVIWRLYPQVRSFVDGRVEVAPVAVWEDYLAVAQAQPGWEAVLERYGLRWLLLARSTHAALIEAARMAGWRCIWGDAQAEVWAHPALSVAEVGRCAP